MDTIEKLVKMKADYVAELAKAGKESIAPLFQGFFTANPEVKAIRWNQYTPYFNDGDECIFGVNGIYMTTDDNPEDEDDDGDSWVGAWSRGALQDIIQKFSEKFSEIPDDVMKVIFGDHVQVIATRDGFEVEEYSHD